jgi:uncharacterized membrane protein
MSLQRRLATLPGPLLVLAVVAAGLLGAALARFVFADPDDPQLWPAAWGVAAIVGAAGGGAAVRRRRRLRTQGRFEVMLAAGEALRAGRLPADPVVRAEVARMIPGQRALLPLFRWVAPVLFGLLAAGTMLSAPDGRPRAWLGVAVFAGLACAYPIRQRRLKAGLDAVEEQLRRG